MASIFSLYVQRGAGSLLPGFLERGGLLVASLDNIADAAEADHRRVGTAHLKRQKGEDEEENSEEEAQAAALTASKVSLASTAQHMQSAEIP